MYIKRHAQTTRNNHNRKKKNLTLKLFQKFQIKVRINKNITIYRTSNLPKLPSLNDS